MRGKQLLIVVVQIFFTFFSLKAQQKYNLKLIYNQRLPPGSFLSTIKETFPDSFSAVLSLNDYFLQLQKDGFLTASLDSSITQRDTVKCYISVGKKYKWILLKKGNVENNLLNKVGFKEKFYNNKTFSISDLKKLQRRLIILAENNGNPFAAIKLDTILIDSTNGVKASLNFAPGPFIRFDSLSIVGNSKIKPKFLSRYFRIEKGEVFSRSRITEAERFLSQFPSIKSVRPADVIYSNYKAYPIFFLNHRPSNVIDGIIGFLPNETAGRKLLITGQFNLQLYNIGGAGKNLIVEWNKLKPLSQILNFQFTNLNLLKTGLDGDIKFNLLKEDTSFINITSRITVSKILSKNSGRINFSTQFKNSRLSGTRTPEMAQNPDAVDFNLISYGIGYQWQKLDDIVIPRKGIKFVIDGLVGNKKVNKNQSIDSLFYTRLSKSNLQMSLTASLQMHTRVSVKSGLYSSLSGGNLIGKQIFINDLFRVGGLKSLRGFNENFFFASKSLVSTLEYRYFFEPESYLLIFYDQAYLKSQYSNHTSEDFPLGVGGGLTLKTNVGTLQVIYSLGKSNDVPFNFNLSKIHFGIINRF